MPKKSADGVSRAAVIVAAGRGERAGGEVPKQYREVGGVPILQRTYDALADYGFDHIVVVRAADDFRWQELSMPNVICVVGGATRTESVRQGLAVLEQFSPDRVFIHDAARPFVSAELIARLDVTLEEAEGAAPTLAVADALKVVAAGRIVSDVPREHIARVQTPQAFRYGPLWQAFRSTAGSFADDVAIAVAAGLVVVSVEGEERNFKITYPADFARAEKEAQA